MSIAWIYKTWEALTKEELYQILNLRSEVFVVEQNCPYLDPDGKDKTSNHLLGYYKKTLIAYARVFLNEEPCVIGRVVVAQNQRKKNIGKATMLQAMERVPKHKEIHISAQEHLKLFYEKLGFTQQGAGYLEDGIPHISMTCPARSSDV